MFLHFNKLEEKHLSFVFRDKTDRIWKLSCYIKSIIAITTGWLARYNNEWKTLNTSNDPNHLLYYTVNKTACEWSLNDI